MVRTVWRWYGWVQPLFHSNVISVYFLKEKLVGFTGILVIRFCIKNKQTNKKKARLTLKHLFKQLNNDNSNINI